MNHQYLIIPAISIASSRPSRIPKIYRPPTGGPLRWQDDESGETQAAVAAYFLHREDGFPMTPEQIEIVRDYCQYYIEAPCWAPGTVDVLQAKICTVKTARALCIWLGEALEIGIDPF